MVLEFREKVILNPGLTHSTAVFGIESFQTGIISGL